MPRLTSLLLAGLMLVPAALAAQDTTKTPPKPKRNLELISAEEVAAAPQSATSAYDLVKQMRSLWLQKRGGSSISQSTPDVQVYVDGIRRGGPEALNDVPRSSIKEIQHLRGQDATMRFGINHENGAIIVILK